MPFLTNDIYSGKRLLYGKQNEEVDIITDGGHCLTVRHKGSNDGFPVYKEDLSMDKVEVTDDFSPKNKIVATKSVKKDTGSKTQQSFFNN